MDYEDIFALEVPEATAEAIWNFLENGRPRLSSFPYKGSYYDRVMLALNDIMKGQGVGKIEVRGEVMAQYVQGFEPTVVLDERTGGFWVMDADRWSEI